MKYKAVDIMRLLQELAEKTDVTLEYASFKDIYDKMEEAFTKDLPFQSDYLYKCVYQKVKKMDSESLIGLNSNYIEHVAKYLSYSNYDQFKKMQFQTFYSDLEKCIGQWYSYVRCNSGQEYVLISPVKISKEGREVFLTLKGRERVFNGRLKLEGNCMYCLLESKQDKNLHLVFKFGFASEPNVLQGVFSGMSTAGDPIAGREILVRSETKFSSMINERRSIAEMLESKSEKDNIIGLYFNDAVQTILKGGSASTFELSDLRKK